MRYLILYNKCLFRIISFSHRRKIKIKTQRQLTLKGPPEFQYWWIGKLSGKFFFASYRQNLYKS